MIATRASMQQHVPGDAKARARWARENVVSQNFYHVRFKLLNAGLPPETENILANVSYKNAPLIVDANPKDYGKTEAGAPRHVIISGGHHRREALRNGKLFAVGWVGETILQAMGIKASDGISADELNQKVSTAISKKFERKATGDGTMSPYNFDGPYIQQLYPFDNYAIFRLLGDTYRIDYTLDADTREVTLTGAPVKVAQEYVDVTACGDYSPFGTTGKIPYVPLGVYVDGTMTLPALFGVSYGAQNSETRNPAMSGMFLNVDQVVATYIANIKNGIHSPILPPAAPVTGIRMLFAKELQARGVKTPADFMLWAAKVTDSRGATAVQPDGSGKKSDWAHTPGDDVSKWKLPIHNKAATRQSMQNFHKVGLKEKHKPAAFQKVMKRASTFGLDTGQFTKINTDLQAGGPGSGPRPGQGRKDGSDPSRPNLHERYAHLRNYEQDNNKPADLHQYYEKRNGTNEDPNTPRGFADGQRDVYGYMHDDKTRDAVGGELTKAGFSKDTLDPVVEQRGVRQYSKSGTSGSHTVMVRPDGSFNHTHQGAMTRGDGPSAVKQMHDDGEFDAAAVRAGGPGSGPRPKGGGYTAPDGTMRVTKPDGNKADKTKYSNGKDSVGVYDDHQKNEVRVTHYPASGNKTVTKFSNPADAATHLQTKYGISHSFGRPNSYAYPGMTAGGTVPPSGYGVKGIRRVLVEIGAVSASRMALREKLLGGGPGSGPRPGGDSTNRRSDDYNDNTGTKDEPQSADEKRAGAILQHKDFDDNTGKMDKTPGSVGDTKTGTAVKGDGTRAVVSEGDGDSRTHHLYENKGGNWQKTGQTKDAGKADGWITRAAKSIKDTFSYKDPDVENTPESKGDWTDSA